MKLNCDNCGKGFERYPSQVNDGDNYCSQDCYWADKGNGRITVECDYCGEQISIPSCRETDKNFCDNECRGNWLSDNRTGESHPNYSKVTVICDNCNTEIKRKQSAIRNRDRFFCDNKCRSEWLSGNWSSQNHPQYSRVKVECDYCGETKQVTHSKFEQQDKFYCDSTCQMRDSTGAKNPSWGGGKQTVTCECCEEEYTVYPHRTERTRFCSKSCRHKWLSKNQAGENHHQYTGYKENYGSDWPSARSDARERFINICQRCGDFSTVKWHPVHHLLPVSSFDNENDAHFPANLVQLCKSCHWKLEYMNLKEQLRELHGSKYSKLFNGEILNHDRV